MLNRIAAQTDTSGSKYDTDNKPAINFENDDIEYQQVNYGAYKTLKVWNGRVPRVQSFQINHALHRDPTCRIVLRAGRRQGNTSQNIKYDS